jgi:hypothetical protein
MRRMRIFRRATGLPMPRVVISDASPLHYLILIGHAEVLSALYTEVLIPEAVASELRQAATPESVRHWIVHPPAWLVPTVQLGVRERNTSHTNVRLNPGGVPARALGFVDLQTARDYSLAMSSLSTSVKSSIWIVVLSCEPVVLVPGEKSYFVVKT